MVSVFWSRSSWDFGFGILPRQSPRALGLYELYPRTFSSFLVLMLHAHDFQTVKKRLLACLLVSWPDIMSTKREKLFALKSLSWSSCWQLLSAAPLLNPVYWNPPGAFWLVIQDNTWLLSFCVFFFPLPQIHFSTKEGWEPRKHYHQRLSLLWLADLHAVLAEGNFQKGLYCYGVIFHWAGYWLSLGHFKIVQKEETNNIRPFCLSPAYRKSELILNACE